VDDEVVGCLEPDLDDEESYKLNRRKNNPDLDDDYCYLNSC
jgi:hypothetical protein